MLIGFPFVFTSRFTDFLRTGDHAGIDTLAEVAPIDMRKVIPLLEYLVIVIAAGRARHKQTRHGTVRVTDTLATIIFPLG